MEKQINELEEIKEEDEEENEENEENEEEEEDDEKAKKKLINIYDEKNLLLKLKKEVSLIKKKLI